MRSGILLPPDNPRVTSARETLFASIKGREKKTALVLPVVDPGDADDRDLLVIVESTRVTLRIVSLLDVDNVAHFMCQALGLAPASQSVESCCLIRAQGEM